jgi:hypothetical protein
MFLDVCVAIGQDRVGCESLAWERTYTSNDKYICQGDWPCYDVGWHYCPYWSCVSWVTWQMAEHSSALLHKGMTTPDCTLGTCNPINFTILNPTDWEQ